MAYVNPTVQDFKDYFVRDFPYGTDPLTSILDSDIAKAYGQSNFVMNDDLAVNQQNYTTAYLLLSAHYLVIDMQNSSQGIGSSFEWNVTNKAAGSVSEGFQIPQGISDNPMLAMITRTGYGAKWYQLIAARLVGVCFSVHGTTLP